MLGLTGQYLIGHYEILVFFLQVSFTDAIRSNLLDRETGAYYHNVDRENIYVGEAIKRGFIKATIVKDPSTLDIDPENKMVVDKVRDLSLLGGFGGPYRG